MRRKKTKWNKLVIGVSDGPVTGRHYMAVFEKLKMDVGPFLNFLGANMRDHVLINQNLDEPIADEGLALHLRLLDRYPELVHPEPAVDDLVQEIKAIRRENPDLQLPMRVTPSFVSLLLGRHIRTASLWSTQKSEPGWKITTLMRDLMNLFETHPNPAAFLEEYIDLVHAEASARGVADLFAAKAWPRTRDVRGSRKPEGD
ncbi:MAG: hypothetical protein JNM60_09620 [Candidatus Competibacteraceae bacterium]|nr:hypothetical protein [Candidatus Competibacteraceae bacterium]